MNFAFLIYMGILKWKLSDENIFYAIFKDLQTNEKVLPYLMKLICFPNYVGLDKMKIRDSVQYRKEIFQTRHDREQRHLSVKDSDRRHRSADHGHGPL